MRAGEDRHSFGTGFGGCCSQVLTSNKELDASSCLDFLLKCITLCLEIRGIPIQDVDVFW